jgi:hypothetical protein
MKLFWTFFSVFNSFVIYFWHRVSVCCSDCQAPGLQTHSSAASSTQSCVCSQGISPDPSGVAVYLCIFSKLSLYFFFLLLSTFPSFSLSYFIYCFCCCCCLVTYLETGSHVAEAGLEFTILLPQPLKCWGHRRMLPHPAPTSSNSEKFKIP